MIVAAARELAGTRVCFVGVGLPNIAVNLAKRTVAPDLELVYEAGVFGARPARLPLSIGDPTIVTGATAVTSMLELFGYYLQGGLIDVGFLGAAQIDSRRRHQYDCHRPLRDAKDTSSWLRRGVRDCPKREIDLRDHAPVAALVRGPPRLPNVGRRSRPRGRDGPGHLPPRRRRRAAPRFGASGRRPPTGSRVDGLAAASCRSSCGHPAPSTDELRLIREELDPAGVYTK